MKLKYLTFLVLSLSLKPQAQNLVYNGNFEIRDTCPDDISHISYALGWIDGQPATNADYFNSCDVYANVPRTIFGYQQDCCGGSGIAGIYTYNKGFPNNARDYIQTKLLDTLKAGRKYLATVYVNETDIYNYAFRTMGMYFTSSSMPWPTNVGFINVPNPQVKNHTLLYDTLNWIMVQDTFIAQGGEIYLTLGNFSTDSLCDTVKVYQMGFGTSLDYAYYFVDGVSVFDITNGSCNSYWDAGYDKYIYPGDSIQLGAINSDGSTFLWQNSAGGSTYLNNNADPRPWASPVATITYYVTKTCPNNNPFTDTVTVFMQPHIGISGNFPKPSFLKVYPNPSNGNIHFTSSLDKALSLKIFGLEGNLLQEYFMDAQSTLDLNTTLPPGLYFYEGAEQQNGKVSGKIVILK